MKKQISRLRAKYHFRYFGNTLGIDINFLFDRALLSVKTAILEDNCERAVRRCFSPHHGP
jgi:hypothetical protein